ncbi:hypothetical protein [Paeniglutamicibacter antarcticus]|uniref:Uncharacterized protein n=1 Tax=Paeniglutamicibacter antarcticus TaxID=494023 RepID=A0ABP9TRK2_9MICC
MTLTTEKGQSMDGKDTALTMRLAMREVRECAYRALMTKGASNSEAQAAARQVLFAELHHGTGLQSLAAWLHDGTWLLGAFPYTRIDTPSGKSYRVDPAAPCHALVHGVLLVDVASTGVGSEVLCSPMRHDTHLLDEALLNAAISSGHTVVHRSAGAENRTTFATPQGDLGTGFSAAGQGAPHTAPEELENSRFYTANEPPQGEFSLSTEAQRTARRLELAHGGILVDAAIWAELRTIAAGYLVADK